MTDVRHATPAGIAEGYSRTAPQVVRDGDVVSIDATGVYYEQLNAAVRDAVAAGATNVLVRGVNGQRYLAAGLRTPGVRIVAEGTAGNDTAMFADGVEVTVHGNAQDGVGNTMSSGRVVVHGDAGDVLGYGMRGGRIYVRGDVGYRVGIHMKAFEKQLPVVVCGGKARDFFGEYMAGGILVLLGMETQFAEQPLVGGFVGTGMHGGAIYLRGAVEPWQCGAEAGIAEATDDDLASIRPYLEEWAEAFDADIDEVMAGPFTRLTPVSHRPYGKLYASL